MKPEQWRVGSSWIWPAKGPLEQAETLRRFLKAGLSCVETGVNWEWTTPTYDVHADRLKAIIGNFQDAGVHVWSVHAPGGRHIDLSHPEYAQAGIDLVGKTMTILAEMGVDKVVLHPSFEPILPEDRPARLAQCAASLKTLYRKDVAMAIENLPRTCLCNTAQETAALLKPLKGIAYACVDVNHSHQDPIVSVLRAAQDQLITVHISDDDGLDEKHLYPGEGVLPWNDILATLEALDYDGCFMYELRWKYEDPAKIRRNFDGLIETYRKGQGV